MDQYGVMTSTASLRVDYPRYSSLQGCFFPPMRRAESTDDRHVLARHSAIYPKKEELDAVHKIVAHNEKAMKNVSDLLAEEAAKKSNARF